jgi:importin subunit alpha-2
MHTQQNVVSAALRTVGNIVTGDDTQTQMVIQSSALPCLNHLLRSPKEAIKKEACWTISNITAGNKSQIQAVIDANIIPTLVDVLGKAEFKTRKEAAWAITNVASGGTADHVRYLVDCNCIPPLCDLLTVMDAKIVQVALNSLENILEVGHQDAKNYGGSNPYVLAIEECSGLDKIEFLQQHENMEIFVKAFDIIVKYFGSEEDENQMAPSVDEYQQQYNFNANNLGDDDSIGSNNQQQQQQNFQF